MDKEFEFATEEDEIAQILGVSPSTRFILDEDASRNWLSLPQVVLTKIFFFLSPRDVVWGVELVCREWKQASSSEFLWEGIHRRTFGGEKPAKKGAGKGREGDELGWRDHCLRSARYLTYMRIYASADDILRWCCACGHLSLFSQMLREGQFTQEMLNGEGPTQGVPTPGAPQQVLGQGGEQGKKTGMSPIHLSSMRGDARMAEILAKRGVDVNRRDSKGATPLSIAAKMGHLSVVEVLLKYGAVGDDFAKLLDHQANTKRRGKKKGSETLPLLHSAVAGGHTQIVNKLLKRAAEQGNLSVLSTLDKSLKTPLHWAAEGGHVPMLELLIRRGAPLQPRDIDFCTPLHLAVGKNHLEAARFLLTKKAPVTPPLPSKMVANAVGTEGEKSPLQIACERGLFEMAKLLLEFGADINMRSKGKGRSILHFAVTGGEGSVALVQYLMRVGKVDTNDVDKKGSMPIHRLCAHPSKEAQELLQILIQNGASVSAKGRMDKTPLDTLLSKWADRQKKLKAGKRANEWNVPCVRVLAETLIKNGASNDGFVGWAALGLEA